MQQQISVITLGIANIARSKRFYVEGFGWKPVFETPEIVFYQMNGLMLGTWLGAARLRPTCVGLSPGPAPSRSLTMSWRSARFSRCSTDLLRRAGACCAPLMHRRMAASAVMTSIDDHAWEIAYNPAWPISSDGRVTFGL